MSYTLKNTIHSPGGLADTQFVTFDMANAFSIRNTRRLPDIHQFSQQILLGSTVDM